MTGQAGLARAAAPSPADEDVTERLRAAIRPEFAAGGIVPSPGDPVLGTPPCAVPGCGRSSDRKGWIAPGSLEALILGEDGAYVVIEEIPR